MPEMPAEVRHRFDDYPQNVRPVMLRLRDLIYEVARTTEGVGALTEALKWGEPAYLTEISKSGTTIRIDWKAKSPNQYALYFNCKTTLVDQCRSLFPHSFKFMGNRALVMDIEERIPEEELMFCISLALRYRIEKLRPQLKTPKKLNAS